MATFSLRLMVMKNTPKIKLNFIDEFHQLRQYTSALFIPGSRASEVFSLFTPCIDVNKYFTDIDKLQYELDCRKLNINALELKNSWDFYKYIDNNKKVIEKRREEISYKMKLLNKKTLDDVAKQDIESLKVLGTVLRQDLRIIKESLWELEETVVPRVLKLPNLLDEKTPIESVVMRSVGEKCELTKNNQKHHIDIGKSLGLIEYDNPLNYYLCNDAALFEIGVTTWAGKLLSDNGLHRVCGPDFARSLVVEAAGLNHEDPFETFLLDNNEDIDKQSSNKLHLLGGASLVSFLAMHTKQIINPKCIPISYYATGRQYQPNIKPSKLHLGLFGVAQSTAIQCMTLVKSYDSDEHKNEFEKLINTSLKLYDDLGVHYRVVLRSISDLTLSEKLRISFEMWSSSRQNYIEVGHLSLYDDYLSKRLLITYQTPTGRNYPAIISGTVLSIPKLLGCLLEENVDKFQIPLCIRAHIPMDI